VVELLQVAFLLVEDSADVLGRNLAAPDRLQLLGIAAKVDVTHGQNLLDLIHQTDDVVGELHVEAVLLTELVTLAVRLRFLRVHLVKLAVGVALVRVPHLLAEEGLAAVADHVADLRAGQHAFGGRKQRVQHVRVSFHAEMEEVHDVVHVQVVLTAGTTLGARVFYVMSFIDPEAFLLPTEAEDFTGKVREDNFLGRDTDANRVEVRRVS